MHLGGATNLGSRLRGNDGIAAMLCKQAQLGNKNFFGEFATLTSNL